MIQEQVSASRAMPPRRLRLSLIWPSRSLAAKLAVIVLAAALLEFPPPADLVERFYSSGIYPFLQLALTPISNLVPFAIIDVLILALVFGIPAWWIIRLRQQRRIRTLASLWLDTLAVAAGVYVVFLALWGFNYSREPLTSKLDYAEQRITVETKQALLISAIHQLNSDSALVHSQRWPGDAEIRQHLYKSFDASVMDLGNRQAIIRPQPKTTLLDGYFGATGVTGMTDPFALEVLFDGTLLPIEKPFILAHESGHLAGFADESEANFIAFLTCARSDLPAVRYSGWLALYSYLPKGQDVLPPLAPAVTADLQAISARIQRRKIENVSRTEQKAYDGFLKANRVKEGIGSYGLFVRLILGTRFQAGWVPTLRPVAASLRGG